MSPGRRRASGGGGAGCRIGQRGHGGCSRSTAAAACSRGAVPHIGYSTADQLPALHAALPTATNATAHPSHTGCEAPLDAPYPSIFMDMARDEGGLLLFIEHRHYGQSLPLGPVASFTNAGLRLLTVEQALADFAAITTAIRQVPACCARMLAWVACMCRHGGLATTALLSTCLTSFSFRTLAHRPPQAYRVPRTAASVASGGSYGGSLAAWARLLYPTTFQASLASSSVVRFMVGTESYQRLKRDTSDAMTRHLRAVGGAACAARVALGFATLQGRASWTSEGRAQLAAAARCAGQAGCACTPACGSAVAPGMPWLLQVRHTATCCPPACSLCPDNVLEGPAEIEGLVALLRDSWWGAFQTLRKKGPDDNAVAAACQRILTAFPATPLGAVAAISNFTRSADLVSWGGEWRQGCGRRQACGSLGDADASCSRLVGWRSRAAARPAGRHSQQPPACCRPQDNAACINAEDSALPFSTKQPRPDDTDWATQYFAQGCLQGLPIRCGAPAGARGAAAAMARRGRRGGAGALALRPLPPCLGARRSARRVGAAASAPSPFSTHFWSAPPSIFGVYSAPLSRIAGWCRRVFGVRHPIRVPPQLQYSPRAYQAVGNIIVRPPQGRNARAWAGLLGARARPAHHLRTRPARRCCYVGSPTRSVGAHC